jgi:hypothetical protein
VNIARETKLELISEELGEEDGALEEEMIFPTSSILEENSDELEISNSDGLPPSFFPIKEKKVDNLTPSQDLDLEEYQDEEDLPILLHAENICRKSGKHAPFFISLMVNEFTLHNCMLDSGSTTNIMPLKVVQQLGLEISRPYKNVCGVDSKRITICGIIKDLRIILVVFPYMSLAMNVVVIDIRDVWGMLLSKEWEETLGGSLQMDLSYAPSLTPRVVSLPSIRISN